jgi:hypothetical protein
MRDVARDQALELLRVQRSRLADRLRPPWWYLPGIAIVWALAFAGPFTSQSFSSPRALSTWAIVIPVLAVACLVQWGLDRATGIKAGPRPLRVLRDGLFYYRPGRPVAIAMFVVSVAAMMTETPLIRHGLLAAAIAVALFAVVAEVALQQARLRAIRQDLRDGGGEA